MESSGGRNNKISASPRPCSARRVLAGGGSKKRRSDISQSRRGVFANNSVTKIQRREICSRRGRSFSMTNSLERFRNIRLQEEYDTQDPHEHYSSPTLHFLKKRSKIVEIVAAHDLIFALAQSGVCAAFSRDNFSSLKCRTTRTEYIRRGQPDAAFPLFESESLKWPGFVEFDDVNTKVVTYSAQDSVYKVFDLKNYRMLYSISDKHIQEIKIRAQDHMLV